MRIACHEIRLKIVIKHTINRSTHCRIEFNENYLKGREKKEKIKYKYSHEVIE